MDFGPREVVKNPNSTIIKPQKMENGGLNDKFSGLTVNDAGDDNLSKVLKAVQVAEATIRQQAEESNRLRAELQKRDQELEYLKVDSSVAQRDYSFDTSAEHRQIVNKARETATAADPLRALVPHQDPIPKSEDFMSPSRVDNQFSVSRSNGNFGTLSGGQTSDNVCFSQLSSPSATLFSPGRFPNDREYDPQTNGPARGLMQVSESEDQSSLQKQIREHEEEIMQLHRHLTQYSVKEAQIRNEKCVLEKRIAHMRMAFDQQQQDLVDATSKALSYRQDIIEENVRLAYALQDVQRERTTFVSSLLPLLTEYSLQPQVFDAQSIVGNVKLLFRHLQENLLITEARLKESQYQLTPWLSDRSNTNFAAQSRENSSGAALTSSAIGLELVPRPTYSPVNLANSNATDWESRGQNAFQAGAGGLQNAKVDNMGRYSPFASR